MRFIWEQVGSLRDSTTGLPDFAVPRDSVILQNQVKSRVRGQGDQLAVAVEYGDSRILLGKALALLANCPPVR